MNMRNLIEKIESSVEEGTTYPDMVGRTEDIAKGFWRDFRNASGEYMTPKEKRNISRGVDMFISALKKEGKKPTKMLSNLADRLSTWGERVTGLEVGEAFKDYLDSIRK